MTITHSLQRRLNMLGIFARYYADHLVGQGYPKSVDKIFAFLTIHEKQTLYRLARALPPNAQLVEIGSYLGGSSCCLAAGIMGKQSELHCIDTFMADNVNSEDRHDTFTQFTANTQPYAEAIRVHRGFSYDVVGEIAGPIDLLFVDGDHSWEGVTQDLKLYIPLMKTDGILILHDSAYPPVQRALKEIVLPAESQRLATLPNMYAGRIRPADVRF